MGFRLWTGSWALTKNSCTDNHFLVSKESISMVFFIDVPKYLTNTFKENRIYFRLQFEGAVHHDIEARAVGE